MSVVRECTKPGLIMARAKGASADRLAVALKVERDTLEVEKVYQPFVRLVLPQSIQGCLWFQTCKRLWPSLRLPERLLSKTSALAWSD